MQLNYASKALGCSAAAALIFLRASSGGIDVSKAVRGIWRDGVTRVCRIDLIASSGSRGTASPRSPLDGRGRHAAAVWIVSR